MIGVLAGCGGAGASVLAAVLAGLLAGGPARVSDRLRSARWRHRRVARLRAAPGPRWGQVRLRGGPLDPADAAGRLAALATVSRSWPPTPRGRSIRTRSTAVMGAAAEVPGGA